MINVIINHYFITLFIQILQKILMYKKYSTATERYLDYIFQADDNSIVRL